MRSIGSHTSVVGLAALAGMCACCSSRGTHADDPPSEPKDVSVMTPAENYAGHIAKFGLAQGTGRVVTVPDLTIGPFEFFRLDDIGTAGAPLKAAASPAGLVAGGARPDDAWHAFLTAAPADVVARRIAWLETDDRVAPHPPSPQP